MNETRAPTDEELKEKVRSDYLKGVKPKALSEKYEMSINTIKSWIKRYGWGKTKPKESAPKKEKGAPPEKKKGASYGNTNARGAGAPKGNSNALKHGIFSKESILNTLFSEEEMMLLQEIPHNEEELLRWQIVKYMADENKLQCKIDEFENKSEKGLYIKGLKKNARMEFDQEGNPCKKVEETSTETECSVRAYLALQSELTKVRRAKNKCIDSLIRLRAINERYDDLLNGWKSKAESLAANAGESEELEDVAIYLPDNGRCGQ